MELKQEFIDFAPVGFTGTKYWEGTFKGRRFLAEPMYGKIELFSYEGLSSLSEHWYNKYYSTTVTASELDDLVECKMYATYKGIEYEVDSVAPRFANIILSGRNGYEQEDLDLGFRLSRPDAYSGIIRKRVEIEDIDSIRVEKRNVYEEYLNKKIITVNGKTFFSKD